MFYTVLGQQQLSRFSYHWLWGLRVDKQMTQTLYDDAVYLQKNPTVKTQIIDQLNVVGQFIWIFSAFYWIFNINQYRVNYYKFYAYVSLSIYQDEMEKMSKHKQEEMISGFLMLVAASALMATLLESLNPGVFNRLTDWFNQRLEPFLFDDIKLYSEEVDIESSNLLEEPHSSYGSMQMIFSDNNKDGNKHEKNTDLAKQPKIIVTHETIKPLELLGFSLKAGDYISLVNLKKAYREKLLLTHPDKTGIDSKKECQDVMDAYKQVIMSIKKKGDSYSEMEKAGYSSTFDELVKEELMKWKELRKQVDEYGEKVRVYGEKVRVYGEKVGAYGEKVRVYGEKVDEINERVSKLSDNFIQISAWQDEIDAANGLPPLTDEEVQAFIEDPDYFNKKNAGTDKTNLANDPIIASMTLSL